MNTTLGQFTIAQNRLPDRPNEHRWRAGVVVHPFVQRAAGVGVPPFWAAAKARLDRGAPGPVTGRFSYKNYVLASDYTILRHYTEDLTAFRKILPQPPERIDSFYYANKAVLVGTRPPRWLTWQRNLMYLNAALGARLQGDLHVVLLNRISVDPDRYTQALKAYWSSDSVGRAAVPKNALVLVLGAAQDTVRWARGFTGMPGGNEQLLARFPALRGTPLNPDTVLGVVGSQGTSPIIVGVLADWLLNSDDRFQRTPMASYAYLKGELQPTPSGKRWILALTAVLASGVWFVPAARGPSSPSLHRERYLRYA
jgi:hypothetical protein